MARARSLWTRAPSLWQRRANYNPAYTKTSRGWMFCWSVPWRCRIFQMFWLDYSHNRCVIGTRVVWRWQRSNPNNPSTHQVRLPHHFYRFGGHIEFIRVLWDAQGTLAIAQYLRALFGQKENFTVYFSGKRRLLLHPNTAQRFFSPLQSFSRKN